MSEILFPLKLPYHFAVSAIWKIGRKCCKSYSQKEKEHNQVEKQHLKIVFSWDANTSNPLLLFSNFKIRMLRKTHHFKAKTFENLKLSKRLILKK